jgi:hypothetical protein
MSVFEGNVADEIGKTWDIVQKGYDDWLSATLESLNQPTETEGSTEASSETKVSE